MARIPDAFIDDLLARTDLVEIVSAHLPLKRVGREFQACCPFHEESTPSFTVSPVKQFFHCFGCSAHGNAIGFLMQHLRIEFMDAVEELASKAGMQVPRARGHGQQPSKLDSLYAANGAAAAHFRLQLQERDEARRYLDERGLTASVCGNFDVGYAPQSWECLKNALLLEGYALDVQEAAGLLSKSDSGRFYDKFRGRLMFPIHNRRGRVVGFGGRAAGKGVGAKYLNSPESAVFHKGRELYGLWQVRQEHAQPSTLLVVEGYVDVLSLHQAGVTNAVATLGTSVTDQQADLLFRTADDVVFCFDGDSAGHDAARRAMQAVLPHMKNGRQAAFVFLPEGQDPDSLLRIEGRVAFEACLADACPLSDFVFALARSGLNLDLIEGRARMVERASPLLDLIPPGAFADLMWQHLAAVTGLKVRGYDQSKLTAIASTGVQPRRSLARTAITLLLQQPTLAATIEGSLLFSALRQPGMQLLGDLVRMLQQYPDLTTEQLLHAFEARPEAVALRKLAVLRLDADPQQLREEFSTVVGKLDKQARARRIEALQAQDLLGDADKRELRDLLAIQRAPKRKRQRLLARLDAS
ncbi:DNA primase [Xanthomonas euvesicatoria]|uniref:DNA primase n=1 Tax=Xanthomonas euvesicatoria TaxID=456327 RepID=UPI001E315EE4|nr:DNA primase [Xanthomonas euvesicatoria]MCC8613711.1 DNA primase [Xanthomonas euvesicatoria pv. euvesicatoria]